jgi:hypothetical protein
MSLIGQINTVVTRIGTEFKSVRTTIGILTNLSTTAKTDLVSAVNENVTAIGARVASSSVGAASGVCPLDASSKVPAANLPGYVDDVLDFANLAAFPATGTAGIIYVADDTNHIYRWSGSAYIDLTGAGTGGVSSFNARTGTVVPATGDYDAFYYTQTQLGDPTTDFVATFNAAIA